jgi:hypothetical protein
VITAGVREQLDAVRHVLVSPPGTRARRRTRLWRSDSSARPGRHQRDRRGVEPGRILLRLLREDFCSGVPFSRLDGDTIAFGEPQTTTEIFNSAVASSTQALAEPGVVNEETNRRRAKSPTSRQSGKARALLNLGNFTAAAAAVAAVPTDFVYFSEHADAPLRIQNAIYNYSTGVSGRCRMRRGASDCRSARRGPRVALRGSRRRRPRRDHRPVQPAQVRPAEHQRPGGRRDRGPADRGRGRPAGPGPRRHDHHPQSLRPLRARPARRARHLRRGRGPALQRASLLALRHRPPPRRPPPPDPAVRPDQATSSPAGTMSRAAPTAPT